MILSFIQKIYEHGQIDFYRSFKNFYELMDALKITVF